MPPFPQQLKDPDIPVGALPRPPRPVPNKEPRPAEHRTGCVNVRAGRTVLPRRIDPDYFGVLEVRLPQYSFGSDSTTIGAGASRASLILDIDLCAADRVRDRLGALLNVLTNHQLFLDPRLL